MSSNHSQPTQSRLWTPSLRPRTSAEQPASAPAADVNHHEEIDWALPQNVRAAWDAPGMYVAHVAAGVKDGIYVGRESYGKLASPLGNPFKGDGAIEQFRAWLKAAIRAFAHETATYEQQQAVHDLYRLRDVFTHTGRLTLVCWCAPDDCHADVIAAAIAWLLESAPILITIPGLGEAAVCYDREMADDTGLPFVVWRNAKVIRVSASLRQAQRPLAALNAPTPAEPRRGEYAVPTGNRVEPCRSCGAAIIWTRTESDRAMPLSIATLQRRDGTAYALPHFVDCPEGNEWKVRR